MQKTQDQWKTFDKGDPLTDSDLECLIESVTKGILFLEARGETGGVLFKARLDRERLMSYQIARERNRNA
ncbi:MAG: hypothetical protein WCO84_06975 [bacterium]